MTRVVDVDAFALLEVENEIEAVREHPLRDRLMNLVGRDLRRRGGQGWIHRMLLSGWVTFIPIQF